MPTNNESASTIEVVTVHRKVDEAELAAAALLARYSGRTLEAYRHDLRSFLEWAAPVDPSPYRTVPTPHGTPKSGWGAGPESFCLEVLRVVISGPRMQLLGRPA